MAATTTAAKAMIKQMGLTNDDAAAEVVDADSQRLSTIEVFVQMDKDAIYLMFKLMSCHDVVTVGAGVKVLAGTQSNFKDMCYFLNHCLNWFDCKTTHMDVQLMIVKNKKFQCQQGNEHTQHWISRIGQRPWYQW